MCIKRFCNTYCNYHDHKSVYTSSLNWVRWWIIIELKSRKSILILKQKPPQISLGTQSLNCKALPPLPNPVSYQKGCWHTISHWEWTLVRWIDSISKKCILGRYTVHYPMTSWSQLYHDYHSGYRGHNFDLSRLRDTCRVVCELSVVQA